MDNFFISYSNRDQSWAEWIAWTLEEKGYSCRIQVWDFKPGENIIAAMDKASRQCQRTIAVLTNNYLNGVFTLDEWTSAFKTGKLFPVRVEPIDVDGLLGTRIYCDLVGLDESSARDTLLDSVNSFKRRKPLIPPLYPGRVTVSKLSPDQKNSHQNKDQRKQLPFVEELLNLLDTTLSTFRAQCFVRNDLVSRIVTRLSITNKDEYETFFCRYFDKMNEEEKLLHSIIRTYTKNILSKCNARIFEILNEKFELLSAIPLLRKLKNHLNLWLAKYNGLFQSTPYMCLVYVGVHEETPFPVGVNDALRAYLGLAPFDDDGKSERQQHEVENLRKWYNSGEPHEWVQKNCGVWDHYMWLCLIEDLKNTPLWPMNIDEVGIVLERLKKAYLNNPEYRWGSRQFSSEEERHYNDRYISESIRTLKNSETEERFSYSEENHPSIDCKEKT